jgi:hypothetical protein
MYVVTDVKQSRHVYTQTRIVTASAAHSFPLVSGKGENYDNPGCHHILDINSLERNEVANNAYVVEGRFHQFIVLATVGPHQEKFIMSRSRPSNRCTCAHRTLIH